MRPSEALREAQSRIGDVEKDAETGCWYFHAPVEGGRSCAGTDRQDIRTCRAREVLRYALVLLGWDSQEARIFAADCHMRGPLIAWIGVANAWRRERGEGAGHAA